MSEDKDVLLHLAQSGRGKTWQVADSPALGQRFYNKRPGMNCEVYVMGDGVDNPSFTCAGELAGSGLTTEKKSPARGAGKVQCGGEDYREGPCGWGGFTPQCLQPWNNPKGYLVVYSLLAIMQGTEQIQSERISQAHNNGGESIVELKNLGKSFKDFPMSLLLMVKNPVLISLTLASCSDGFITTGFATFLPKFIENQFSLTSSFSAVLGGGVLIPAAAVGQVLGGVIVSRFKLECKNIIKFSLISSIISVALTTVFIFARCGNDPFAGVSALYNGTGKIGELDAPCNSNCSCARSFYDPVCGSDGVQYFSGCYAGCADASFSSPKKVYSNCSCIGFYSGESEEYYSSKAVPGKCQTTCSYLIIFMAFFFFAIVATFTSATPITMAILRCVPVKQRSFALGVQWSLVRLLGSIPGPILFGVIIDSTCILWNFDECGTKGACWTYNNSNMSISLISISAASKSLTILFLLIALCVYKPPTNNGDSLQDTRNIVSSESL
ncbi:hypothetical protein GDO86_002213 [Hymenochirus boettgeri]|uniref:Kazal-like domain-containing protein n=1 Tax=Hymenochirus boettgeri TaxID=247094 RepID=A0A8T2KII7_9PIPI|nr:hypothetical protein GDO86_002213 [Hymenochirus boettgeri]